MIIQKTLSWIWRKARCLKMSKYTTQLRYLCEQKAGYLESQDDYVTVINKSYNKIIHPETPLYDRTYEPVLYKKIIRHYYFDEIGHETAAQFIMRLNMKLDEILPYYNQLYRSAALEFNPFYDVDYYTAGNREDNNTDDRTRTDDLQNKRTDDLQTERTDDLTSLRTDDLTSLRTDDLQTERTDDLTSLRTDNLQSERTDDLTNTRTDNLNSQRTDNLTGTRTDNLANSATSTSTELFSDTPEGSLSGVTTGSGSYLTTAKKIDSSASGTNTGTQTTVNTGTQTTADTGTQTTKNTGTQTVKDTGTQTVKDTGTQTTENTGTQSTENTGTQTTENTGTQTTENTGTQTFKATGTQTNNAVIHNLNEYFEHVYGKRGGATYSELLLKFRETFLNIDMMIINDLKDLFMQVY